MGEALARGCAAGPDRLVEGGGASAVRARCFECLGLKWRPVGLCRGPWQRRWPGSSTCPSSPPTCCGTAALGATWCRTFCPPASCRLPSQVRPDPTPTYTPLGLVPPLAHGRDRLCSSAAFRAAFRARGALAVLQHFDPIYSLLQ